MSYSDPCSTGPQYKSVYSMPYGRLIVTSWWCLSVDNIWGNTVSPLPDIRRRTHHTRNLLGIHLEIHSAAAAYPYRYSQTERSLTGARVWRTSRKFNIERAREQHCFYGALQSKVCIARVLSLQPQPSNSTGVWNRLVSLDELISKQVVFIINILIIFMFRFCVS